MRINCHVSNIEVFELSNYPLPVEKVIIFEPYHTDINLFLATVIGDKKYVKRLLGSCWDYPFSGSGVGITEREAVLRAFGEYTERFIGMYYQFIARDKMIFATYRDLDKMGLNALSPHSIQLFHKRQYQQKDFPYSKFCEDSLIKWMPGKSLITNEEVYVPASFVLTPYIPERGENLISPSVTTGSAAHSNLTQAIINGIYEVIERDTARIYWYGNLRSTKLKVDNKDIKDFIDFIKNKKDIEVIITYMENDLNIPTFMASIIIGKNNRKSVVTGLSSNINPINGLKKAITEAFHTYLWKLLTQPSPKQQLENFTDHVALYLDPKMYIHFIDFINSNEELSLQSLILASAVYSFDSAERHLNMLIRLLKNKVLDLIVVDITPEILRKTGIHVVKVIIPPLLSILAGHIQYLGDKRLYNFSGHSYEELRCIPHPYP
ncbi:hypothetical protein PF0002 [Pyrococcus furiosus DSM 3638]|uniref:YcaO domain-containing protein n=1 Tax=Pyrococcus furiosus (strain ATCC 43587 / DSM 3638 / JCM 8422 / Vc1) TaxID=186497 RepID=Q8U4S1_PYRFU|nr:YcaO-like family protein [Pyrococcus furiosus]AAL80126.1 hypothetical protein PF0002 [Pyrococcus furiosus DSM 3638]